MNQQLIKELFTYKDGELYWNKQPHPWHNNDKVAGSIRTKGYIEIHFKGKSYKAHRLIWMYHYGAIPKGIQIDHLNRDRTDNRIENLRLVTNQENQFNKDVKGYSWHKPLSKWRVQIGFNNNIKHVGYYITECGARLAYLFAKLNRTLNHG